MCTMVTAIWPTVCKQCFVHWYQAMQTVPLTGIASSWSSVQVPLFCEHCTKVQVNNCIASSSVKTNTYLSVLSFNFWHPPRASIYKNQEQKCFATNRQHICIKQFWISCATVEIHVCIMIPCLIWHYAGCVHV
jgi:hypothetical protein